MRKLRKGDEVIIIAGKDKGRRGEIREVVNGGEKVIVEGANMAKKHVRPDPNRGIQGGIVEKEMPLAISNVAIFNPETDKADRVGIRVEDDKKVRFFKSTGKSVGA